ncbi:Amine oxidase [Only Syngen Nebraska virus 5]|uniref:Amine oxidase n=1 Tax=Only Syngen Nebraska virus 5 TaxID=1917232 RepID=UPI000901B631|nr:Amine oxidase [Only Syngen Nebraska virus 5]APC25611.1 Amine oxidase [Only Syngen Nebraska virus 5]
MTDLLDYVVIGGGVAGLYANYKLYKKNKREGLLLEKNSDVFGRAREHDFHGTKIKCGAGIAVPQNKSLVKLLKKFRMNTKVIRGPAVVDKRLPPFDMKNAVKQVKIVYKKMTKKDLSTLTSREILYKYFSKEFADEFIHHSEFHDYLDGSFEYLFKYYDIDDLDNAAFGKIFVDWTAFVEKLKLPNIRTDYAVKKVEKKGKIFIINDEIKTKEVIFAVTVSTFDAIKYIGFKMPVMSDFIGSTPFCRMYAYYEKGYSLDDDYVMVDGPVDKIIKINKNVLMASYSDGNNALFWKTVKGLPMAERRRVVRDELSKVGYDFGLPDDVFSADWTDGDHYVKPYKGTFDKLLDKLSKPTKGVMIVGELLSKRNGYVDGALTSVERVIK